MLNLLAAHVIPVYQRNEWSRASRWTYFIQRILFLISRSHGRRYRPIDRSAKPRSVSPQDCLRSRGISESSLPIVLRSMWTRPSAQAGLSSLGNTFSMSSELFSVQLARNNPDTISPLSEQISAISRIFSSVEGNGMRGAVFIRGRIPGNTSRPGG